MACFPRGKSLTCNGVSLYLQFSRIASPKAARIRVGFTLKIGEQEHSERYIFSKDQRGRGLGSFCLFCEMLPEQSWFKRTLVGAAECTLSATVKVLAVMDDNGALLDEDEWATAACDQTAIPQDYAACFRPPSEEQEQQQETTTVELG